MLVYGDPQFILHLSAFTARLRHLLSQAKAGDLESRRRFLFQAGQLEQGIGDWADQSENGAGQRKLLENAAALTDQAARLFHNSWLAAQSGKLELEHFDCSSEHCKRPLAMLSDSRDLELLIKIPEGFEFYTLHPEQYILSTLSWIEKRSQSAHDPVLVAGVRSIGTTLSDASRRPHNSLETLETERRAPSRQPASQTVFLLQTPLALPSIPE